MPRSPGGLAVAVSFVALFLGGAVVGLELANALAPGSWTANAVSFFALPLAFATSLQAWYGFAVLGIISRLLRGRLRPAGRPSASASLAGSWVFLPISVVWSAGAGLIAGLVSPTQPLWLVTPIYGLVGTMYGLLAWRLARAGFLLPPETA